MSEQRETKDGVAVGAVEVRGAEYGTTRIEIRADEDGEPKGIRGLGIPVGVRADIGPFTEEISPEAVQHAIDQGWDIRGLANHDPNMLLGKTRSGTMTVRATEQGLEYDIPELPKSRGDVLESVTRGDLDGNSFSFMVDAEEVDRSEDLPKPHRTIKRFAGLFDTGPVAFPAYEGLTVVSARSLAAARGEQLPEAEEVEEARDEVTETPDEPDTEARKRANADRRRKLRMVESEAGSYERRQSDQDLRDQLREALWAWDVTDGSDWVFVEAVFSDEQLVVFELEGGGTLDGGLYRTSYEIDADSVVTFGEPERVRRVTTYEPIGAAA